jgi:hypothetical protein
VDVDGRNKLKGGVLLRVFRPSDSLGLERRILERSPVQDIMDGNEFSFNSSYLLSQWMVHMYKQRAGTACFPSLAVMFINDRNYIYIFKA